MNERPFVYRVVDPIQHLVLRVSVREVHSSSTQDDQGSAATRRRRPVVQRVYSWQEKASPPWDANGSDTAEADERKRQLLETLRRDGVFLYTYVDKDSHVPQSIGPFTTSSLPPVSAQPHDREGSFKSMYVVASVPVAYGKVEKAIEEQRFDGLRDPALCQEHVLCVLRVRRARARPWTATRSFGHIEPHLFKCCVRYTMDD